ncbi:serine hydrolase [Erythrobacter sp. LQ02-29]|uniref:serine hydrolase n=1 Tax=Erythrobacter sp. LQ02-29 TaxID=2920384 RepID=UPI001F4DCAF2|nr:serine hydrolase [Erythrobacter sp. LQ02-29]MCP9223801.1 serine hydrolase [Erythrobacter sp. LQ02-29]
MTFARTGAALLLSTALAACAHTQLDTPTPPVPPTPPAVATAAAAPDYDAALQRTMQAYDSTGMVAAVSIDGKTVWQGARGLAEEGTNRPVTQDMLFPIASISKAFTTTALAMLVDQGKVDWDAPVRTYIPEFAMYDPWVSEHFTVRDALTHRSGLPLGAGDLLIWPDGDAKPEDIIKALPLLRPTTGFRAEYAYDNLLYVVAGEIVRRVSGQSWSDFVTANILQPVGMGECVASKNLIPAGEPFVIGHERAAGADAGVPIDERLAFSETWNPAGGIWCDTEGMMKWGRFWLDGGVTADGKRLLSEKQAAEVWKGVTPETVSGSLRKAGVSHLELYALGWNVQDFEGQLLVSHGGGAPGVVSNFMIIPEENIVLFSATNDYRGAPSTFNFAMADELLGQQDHDFIGEWGGAFAKREAEGTKLLADTAASPPADAKPASLPLSAYVGTYRDPWYGEVRVRMNDAGGLFIDMGRSEILDGDLTHYNGDRFAAFWPDSSLKADAFVDFTVAGGKVTGMTMKAISDLTDFSYDFHDLDLKRVGN